MHTNVVFLDAFRRERGSKHGFDQIVYDRLKNCCSTTRINRAQRMCAANIRNGTQEQSAIDAAVRWASVNRNPEPPSAA